MSTANMPKIDAEVFHTRNSTPYLKEAGVVMISKPDVNISGLEGFLEGFDKDLEFENYIYDPVVVDGSHMGSGTHLCKTAGQICYMSFGPKRTKNKDANRYFDNIISSGHGSVLEHANYSFLIYGISRSLTHELVRHRAGMAYSQVSQRYVDGSKLRFVERPEFSNHDSLHVAFENRIDRYADDYDSMADYLRDLTDIAEGKERTDARKAVNQTARAILPNETEAPIVATGNVRAWRHILEMRGSEHAESEIRNLALKIHFCLREIDEVLFRDFNIVKGNDNSWSLKKVDR